MLFTRLRVWHAAMQLADDIYALTEGFPADERYRLVLQLRKGAVIRRTMIIAKMLLALKSQVQSQIRKR